MQKILPKITVATLAFSFLPVYFTGNLLTKGGDNQIQKSLTGTVVSTVANNLEKRLITYKSLAKGALGEVNYFNTFLDEDSEEQSLLVLIIDGDESIYTNSPYEFPEEILSDVGIKTYPEDIIESELIFDFLKDRTVGQKIIIKRAPVVNIDFNGSNLVVRSWAKSLGELFNENNIAISSSDKVNPSVGTPITNGMNVKIIKVSEGQKVEIVAIPRSVVYKGDPNLFEGTSRVQDEGRDGAKEVTYKVVLEDGVEVSRVVLSEKLIYDAIPKVILKGTRPKITYTSGAFSEWINDASAKYGIDATKLQRVMICESGGNPNSVGGGGMFHGLFQYMRSTWAGASYQAGYGGASIYDPKAQIYVTAWKASIQGWGAWPVCGYR